MRAALIWFLVELLAVHVIVFRSFFCFYQREIGIRWYYVKYFMEKQIELLISLNKITLQNTQVFYSFLARPFRQKKYAKLKMNCK